MAAQRPLSTGDWGESAFVDAWSTSLENCRRLSQFSYLLNEFGDLKYSISDNGNATAYDRALSGWQDAGSSEGGSKAIAEVAYLKGLEDRDVKLVHAAKGLSIETLENDLDFSAPVAAVQLSREESFAAIAIPPPLYGLTDGRATPSGAALSKEFFATSLMVQGAQSVLDKAVRRALLLGAVVEGHSESAIQEYNERLEIRWRNPFDDSVLVGAEGEVEQEFDTEALDANPISDLE